MRPSNLIKTLAAMVLMAAVALAQAPGDCPAPPPPRGAMRGSMMRGPNGPGPGPGLGMGKWWNNPPLERRLGLTEAQVQQMENVFQQHRAQLAEMRNSLRGLEAGLGPMIEMNRLNEAQITAQIDKIAQARANLEKLSSLMLLDLRRALTAEQWKMLKEQRMTPRLPAGSGTTPPPLPQ